MSALDDKDYQKRMNLRCKKILDALTTALIKMSPRDDKSAAAKEFTVATAVSLLAMSRYFVDVIRPEKRLEILEMGRELRRFAYPKVSDDDVHYPGDDG